MTSDVALANRKALANDVAEKQKITRLRVIHAVTKVYTSGVWARRTRGTWCPGGLCKDK